MRRFNTAQSLAAGWVILVSTLAVAQSGPGPLTGLVKEKIDASVYTYLRVAAPGGDVWAAVPTASVAVGQKVTVTVQTVMPNFESKSLGRTFERLAFGTLEGAGGGQVARAPEAASAPAPNLPSGHPATSPKPLPGAELLTPRPGSQKFAAPATAPSAAGLDGDVLEVLEVPSYTYLRLKTASGEQWAAVPTTAVKVGVRVRVKNPMVMQNFESKVLKRHFERIVFGTLGG